MSHEDEEVTFSKVKRNGLVAKKKMPVFRHGGWREYLKFMLKLQDHSAFMGYTAHNDDQEDFIEDVQLLLHGNDLRTFNEIANDAEVPRAMAVVAALRTLTAYHCPPGTRRVIINELRNMRKRVDTTVRQFSAQFRELLYMIPLLQHGEDAPIPVPDVIQLYYDAMPYVWQDQFDALPQIWATLEQVEAHFDHIERNERKKAAGKDNRRRNDNHDSKPQKGNQQNSRGGKESKKTSSAGKRCAYCESRGYKHNNHNNDECFKDPDSPKYRPLKRNNGGGKNGGNLQAMQRQLETLAASISKMQKNDFAAMRFYEDDDSDTIAVSQTDSPTTRAANLEVQVLLDGEREPVTALLDTGCTQSVMRASAVTKGMTMTKDPSTYRKADGTTGTTSTSSVASFTLPKIAPHRKCTMAVRVTDQLLYPIILGLDFLRAQGMVLDFGSETLKWDEVTTPMRPTDSTTTAAAQSHTRDMEEKATTINPRDTDEPWVGTFIPVAQKSKILGLIARHRNLCNGEIGTAKLEPYVIPLKADAKPFATSPYPLPRAYYEATRKEVQRLVQLGILEPDVSSPWAAPAFVVLKKDGTVRLVADFRRLNLMLQRHYFPLPKILEIFHQLPKPNYITTLDLIMGYYARVLAKQSRACTAIVLPFGKFRYCRLPMGIATAPDEFQAVMTAILGDLEFVRVYLDDILVISDTFESHLEHLEVVFNRLEQAGFVLNMKKSHFCVKEAEYLGYQISVDGISPLPSKVEGIQKLAEPRNRRELRRFIGMVNYYRDVIPRRASILTPLTAMCSPKATFQWTTTHQAAFEAIKRGLAEAVTLAYPDFSLPFEIHTDASKDQLGAVISQQEHPLVFWSKKCNDAQRKYPANKLELLSILLLLREFRTMLMGQRLNVHTDHKNLTCDQYNNVQMLRWRLEIEEFGPTISYIKSEHNVVADALSRLPHRADDSADLEEKPTHHSTIQQAAAMNQREPFDLEEIAEKQRDDPECNDPDTTVEREVSGVRIRAHAKNNKILVPASLRPSLMETYHDWLIHPGVSVMYKTITAVFHWKNVDKDVQNMVLKCKTCSTAKYPSHNTRLIEIQPTRDGTSAEAAAIVDRYWFNKYPRPRRCVYDQGSEFKLEFLELLDSYGVEHVPTTTRNPQANGVIERVHRVIGDKMRTRDIQDHDDWDNFLQNVTFALRAAHHTMTGASPAQLAFGRDMMVDIQHETDWKEQKERKLQQLRANNERENKDRTEWTFQPGDKVFLKNDVKVRGKLLPIQSGPYEVVSTRDNGTLTIDKGKYTETVSIRRIAPCRA